MSIGVCPAMRRCRRFYNRMNGYKEADKMKKAMALLLACRMVLAFAACSKKQYTEQEVTAVVDVTDENGKTVTDKDGKAQTRVVTIPQTDAKGNTVAAGESAADGKSAGNGGSAAKDGKDKTYYLSNICDHQECYKAVGAQAVAYTTGVPAMIGTKMVVNGLWNKPGVYNTDEFDPDPYMEALNKWGLPWKVVENPVLVD